MSRTVDRTHANAIVLSREWFYPAFALAFYYLIQTIGLNTAIQYEEARDANAFLMAMEGLLPYRDFDWLYGPLSFLIYPKLMAVFGTSLNTLRFSYMLFVGLTIPVSYLILRRLLPAFQSALGSLLSIVFLQIPFYTYNHVFVVLFSLTAVLSSLVFHDTKKSLALWISGLSLSLVILTKPVLPGFLLSLVLTAFWLTRTKEKLKTRITILVRLFVATTPLLLAYAFSFYLETAWLGKSVAYPPFFSKDSVTQTEQVHRLNPSFLLGILESRIKASFFLVGEGVRKRIINQYTGFTLMLLPLVPLLYGLFFRKRIAVVQRATLDLLALLGLLLSLETVPIAHGMNRAFTAQGSFLLLFTLPLLLIEATKTRLVTALALFGYLAAVPLFYFPVGKFLKYKAPLELRRVEGLKIEPKEKTFYEDFHRFIGARLGENEKMAVIGYYPTIPFLSERRNIFEDEEYLFLNLHSLREFKGNPARLEKHLIEKIQSQKPKVLLSFHSDPLYSDYFDYLYQYRDYVESNYTPIQRYSNVDLYGLGQIGVQVVVYEKKNAASR